VLQEAPRPSRRQRFLLALCVIGFLVPNFLVGYFLADEGFHIGSYFEYWFDSTPGTQITLDLVITATAFLGWASWDGPRQGVRNWWYCIPATFLVGICFGAPLYLYQREKALGAAAA
jgi:hypothetical protein